MKKALLVFLLFVLPAMCPGLALGQGWQWAKGGECTAYATSPSSAHAWPVATDASGNVYVAMWSSFDTLGVGASSHHSAIYQNQVVLVKYDNSGNVLWSVGSTEGNTMPIDIAVDANSNVFLYGYFTTENVKFGAQEIVSATGGGENTCYVIKFDKDGNYLWKVNSGTISLGSEKQCYGGLVADKQGNVYAAATYYGSVKIGAITLPNEGCEDISLTKYSPAGGLLWAKRFGGAGYDRVGALTINTDNRIVLAGEFSSPTVSFGATTLSYMASWPSMGYSCFNVFVAQINNDGNVEWARQSNGNTRVMSVVTDNVNDVYIGGTLRSDTVSFSGFAVTGSRNNPYLVKYSSTGNLLKVKPFIQTLASESHGNAIWGLTVDACNNVWVAGGMDTLFGNGVYLDSVIIMPAPQATLDPMFMASYSPDGLLSNYAALRSGGKSNSGLAADRLGNVFLCGYYDATETFRVGDDSLVWWPNARKSYFVAKYMPYGSCIPNSVAVVAAGTAGIAVFPNPVANKLTISSPSVITNVVITDLPGRMVYSAEPKSASADINVSGLRPGMYLVYVNGREVRKFVKE